MPDPQNNEIEIQPSPMPEAVPENISAPAPALVNLPNPLYQGGVTPGAETLPAEAPINPADNLPQPSPNPEESKIPPAPFDKGGVNIPASASPASAMESPPASNPAPSLELANSPIKNLLLRAKEKIQFRKRAKSEKIMDLAKSKAAANAAANAGRAGQAGQGKITNDDVEKLLHCSDATARVDI